MERPLLQSFSSMDKQIEERSRLVRRIKYSRYMLKDLFDTMRKEELSPLEKIQLLKKELSIHHSDDSFLKCRNMAGLVRKQLFKLL
jgi:hypothetical protein